MMMLKRNVLAAMGVFAVTLAGCGAEPGAPLKNPGENTTETENAADDTAAGSNDTSTDTGNTDTGTSDTGNSNTGNTDTGNSGSGNDDSSGNSGDTNTPSGNTGGGNSGSDNAGNNGNTSSGTGSIDNIAGSCEPTPFSFSDVGGFSSANYQVVKTFATSQSGGNTDYILVESYQDPQYGGPTAPGTYELSGSNYADCGLCVLVYKSCVQNGDQMQCEKYFFAEEGTVQINAIGGAGSAFDVELLNMNLVEVTIDESYTSVPVAGGESWCAHGYNWTTVLEDSDTDSSGGTGGSTGGSTGSTNNPGTVGECTAPANGTGTGMGDQIGDFTLTDCNGQTVSLHDSCGQSRIMWLIGTATWCSYCPQQVAEAVQTQAQVGAENLAFYVIADDVYDVTACQQYAQQEGVDRSQMLFSPQGATSTLLNRVSGIGSGFPMNAILNGSSMELLYAGDGYAEGLGDQIANSLNQ